MNKQRIHLTGHEILSITSIHNGILLSGLRTDDGVPFLSTLDFCEDHINLSYRNQGL